MANFDPYQNPGMWGLISAGAAMMDPRGTYGNFGSALNNGLRQGLATYAPLKDYQLRQQAAQAQQEQMRMKQQALTQFMANQQSQPQGGQTPPSQFVPLANAGYSIQDIAAMQKMYGGGGGDKYGLGQPIWATDGSGGYHIFQPSSSGGAQEINLPNGLKPYRDPKTVAGGNQTYILGGGQVQGSLPIGVSPDQTPALKGAQAEATTRANQMEQARGTWQSGETKIRTSIATLDDQNTAITESIARAKDLLSNWSAQYGAALSSVPASDAKALSNVLDTIKANVGFAALNEMRASSPTGGALGQVSEMENKLLQSTWGSLDQKGKISDLMTTLDRIQAQRTAALERLKWAYKQDASRYGSTLTGDTIAPTMPIITPDGWKVEEVK